MYLVFPLIMKSEIKKRLILKEGTEAYKNWKDIPVPIYIHFYFFNVTNKDEIYSHTNKPVLQQLGPYTFREEREKVGVFSYPNGTLTYRQVRRWYFDADKTNGSLDDLVTTLNVPMVASATKAKQINKKTVYFAVQEIFELFQCTWFVQKTVRELLFEGYEDPLMKLAREFMHVPFDKFGWFYNRNGSDDGEMNIFTGQEDIENLDIIHTWNQKTKVSSYSFPCNIVNGSAGDMWSPNLSRDSKVSLFVTDICRSVTFKYLADIEVKGVRAYRYWLDETQLDNGKYDPANRCFCSNDNCLPAGALNVSSCTYESPAVVSYPHFLFADPEYREGVIGMKPNPDEHRMYLDLVPEMGVPVGVAARMQINIVFEAIPEISQFRNITKRIYFPVLWFSETAETGEDVADQIKTVLNTIPLISKVIFGVLIFIGSLLSVLALMFSIQLVSKKNCRLSYSVVTDDISSTD